MCCTRVVRSARRRFSETTTLTNRSSTRNLLVMESSSCIYWLVTPLYTKSNSANIPYGNHCIHNQSQQVRVLSVGTRQRVPAYRVYAQLTSTLQRGMLSHTLLSFRQRRRHRLEGNSITCSTPHCSSSTEAYQPTTNALKSVVESTTALLFLQPM